MIGSSLQIFICGWWLCPELYLRRPFHIHASSRLDALLEAKAKQGVQVYVWHFLFPFPVHVIILTYGLMLLLFALLLVSYNWSDTYVVS